jgi:hypothetical protein
MSAVFVRLNSSADNVAAVLPPLSTQTHTVLHEHRPQLPTNMLALMTELEKQGPVFATKMLITIVGACEGVCVFVCVCVCVFVCVCVCVCVCVYVR